MSLAPLTPLTVKWKLWFREWGRELSTHGVRMGRTLDTIKTLRGCSELETLVHPCPKGPMCCWTTLMVPEFFLSFSLHMLIFIEKIYLKRNKFTNQDKNSNAVLGSWFHKIFEDHTCLFYCIFFTLLLIPLILFFHLHPPPPPPSPHWCP